MRYILVILALSLTLPAAARARWYFTVAGADQAKANAAALVVDTVGGDQTFTTPLLLKTRGANYKGAADFYWCSWVMENSQKAKLESELTAAGVTYWAVAAGAINPKQVTMSPTATLNTRAAKLDLRDSFKGAQHVVVSP